MAGKTLIRRDLASAIREEVGLTYPDCYSFVDEVLDLITDALVKGEMVKIAKFGAFIPHGKRERIGRNPKTGEEVPISARRVIKFRASAKLRHVVNHPEDLPQRPKAQGDLFGE